MQLLLALFRVLEPAGGTIYIDGVDITTIGLHDCEFEMSAMLVAHTDLHAVRSAISIVPQSPDLFEGTVRENIDPVGEHSDADIWVDHSKEDVEKVFREKFAECDKQGRLLINFISK